MARTKAAAAADVEDELDDVEPGDEDEDDEEENHADSYAELEADLKKDFESKVNAKRKTMEEAFTKFVERLRSRQQRRLGQFALKHQLAGQIDNPEAVEEALEAQIRAEQDRTKRLEEQLEKFRQQRQNAA